MSHLNSLAQAHIRQFLPALLLLICFGGAATCEAQTRYTYSTDGAEVTDSQTGLTWRRCSQGQSWSGSTCTGTVTPFTHEQALAHAKSQSGWRLPNAKELLSLSDIGRGSNALDTTAFPNTPAGIAHWSSTPFIADSSSALSVYISGATAGTRRSAAFGVRLVR